ncbi:BnaCnng76480D [Brassica napus]|uniref:BnaCnng76480D protein n=1 Tax=Brassica napus TaxID=3708 RepID=A0A078K2T0_BRANA|nr:BnaCnng76480D [Brassica napus]
MVKANVLSKIRGFSGVNRPIYVLAGLAFLISVATLAKFNYITPLRFSGRFCNNHGSFDGDNYILGSQMRKTIESAIFKIHQEMDDLKALEANSSAPPSDSSASGSMFRHVAFLADVLSLIQSVHMELPSLEEVDHPLKQRNGDPGEHFMREEIKKYIKIKPNRLGKQNFMGANGTFTSIGHACFAMKKDLEEYMDYDVGEICNDDWRLAQKLMVHGCDPLPRRRCFSRAPQLYYKPFPINEWVNRGELDPETNQTADFSIQEVLEIKPGEIRIGLDFSVGTGTFAARMRESNVTIVTATINLGAPFNEMISLRGLVPLYLTVNQRLPFFDSTLDMIHTTRFLDGWIDLILLDFVLFDWDRVLRPGGLLWIDSFFCLKEDLGDYMEAFKALRYRRHKWVVVPKRDKDDKEVFFSAVLEKPPRPFR